MRSSQFRGSTCGTVSSGVDPVERRVRRDEPAHAGYVRHHAGAAAPAPGSPGVGILIARRVASLTPPRQDPRNRQPTDAGHAQRHRGSQEPPPVEPRRRLRLLLSNLIALSNNRGTVSTRRRRNRGSVRLAGGNGSLRSAGTFADLRGASGSGRGADQQLRPRSRSQDLRRGSWRLSLRRCWWRWNLQRWLRSQHLGRGSSDVEPSAAGSFRPRPPPKGLEAQCAKHQDHSDCCHQQRDDAGQYLDEVIVRKGPPGRRGEDRQQPEYHSHHHGDPGDGSPDRPRQ